ncbi:His-Xaa-Ser system radical SAM maturase HxsC [Ferrovibrio sp.]|uniref:His-Xaa-Ser system radical SAM maturase HxsC n=1 Tax=Ferrovibrio sp. TaxID=1917215 RepID=UPI003514B481
MNRAIGLHTHAVVHGVDGISILKVLTAAEAMKGQYSLESSLIWESWVPGAAGSINFDNGAGISINRIRDEGAIKPGDVIRLRQNSSLVSVLYRRGSKANTLFATEQCNSDCVMCSQPPRNEDDSWRVRELERTIELVDRDEVQLGVSGGEPTLLGDRLGHLIDHSGRHIPETVLHILSNGRALGNPALATQVAGRRLQHVVWAVPLYADVADLHDEVVRAPGGFKETLDGLYQLGRLGARVELRVVLHRMTVGRLPKLASFIYRRLPFVEHVALMGLEPMGFAKRNRDQIWIDPADYMSKLKETVFHLHNRGITTSIYNLPLCVLPTQLWPFAEQSISDWKNVYAADCEGCLVMGKCAGFFVSAGPAWRSRAVRPIVNEEHAA